MGPVFGNQILLWAKTDFGNLQTVTWMPPLPAGASPSQGHFDDHAPRTYNKKKEARGPKARTPAVLKQDAAAPLQAQSRPLSSPEFSPLPSPQTLSPATYSSTVGGAEKASFDISLGTKRKHGLKFSFSFKDLFTF